MSETSSQNALLRAVHLSRIYPDGQVNALVDVSLSIGRGEYVAIMGPSGSGKSTLLNLFGGLDAPTSGEVFCEDQSLTKLSNLDRYRAEKIGFVFQSFLLLPTLSAARNIQVPMFQSALTAAQRARKAQSLLAVVGLSHRADHLPTRLSVGERQRVAVARALANDPPILLADEPTGNLDSRTAAEILDLFDRLHRERTLTIVVVTHAETLAQRAGRVIRLEDGRIVDDTSPRSSA